jgi:hypothetical protein
MRVGLGVILASGAHLHLEMKIGLEIRRRYRLDCSSCRVSSYQLISLALGRCRYAESSLRIIPVDSTLCQLFLKIGAERPEK